MWIKKIELRHFKNIWTGLKLKRLMIDFSNKENTICLFVGPNGIGKTSFLSCLTPFATLGNLDIRDGNPIILEGEEGYKRIIIMNDDTEYDIEHFYTPTKERHTVKSYFKQDGMELNPNGNVISFKALVKEFLGIDMDYLKLIRIGDNVTNLIKLKATERKNFMSKFLNSVDIYLKYHKKILEDVKDIKLIISHDVDKINRLHIEDIDIFKKEMQELEKAIISYGEEIEDTKQKMSEINYQLGILSNHRSREEIHDELREKKALVKKWEKSLDKNKEYSKDSSKLRKKIEKSDKEVIRITGLIEGLSISQENLVRQLDTLYKSLTENKKNLELEKSNSNIDSLEEYLLSLHKRREELDKTLKVSSPTTLSKEEVDEFVIMIKNVQRTLNTTYEFGKEPIKNAITLIKENADIGEYIASKLLAIEKKKKKDEMTYLDKIIEKYDGSHIPDTCDCPLKNMYKDIMLVKKLKPSNPNTVKGEEFYQMVKAVYDNILYCLDELEKYKDYIKKLPDDIQKRFSLDALFESMSECKMIYNEKKINRLMLEVTEIHNYNTLIKEIEDTCQKLVREKEISRISFYEEQISHDDCEIKKTEKELLHIQFQISDYEKQMDDLTFEVGEMRTLVEALEKYDGSVKELDDLIKVEEYIQELLNDLNDMCRISGNLEKKKEFLVKQLREKEFALSEYKKLNKELKKAQNIYDDLIAIKTSTSNTKGIPLVFIDMYLKDIAEFANKLLDTVYNGSLYIHKFDVQADSFKIPFIKDGIEIPDISLASQGEQSFLNMAISFALSAKNLDTYNIPLLDEVDATFDRENRERCLDVIDHLNEDIHCEQEFIISHNNMYDQYPVDVLDFIDLENSKFHIEIG